MSCPFCQKQLHKITIPVRIHSVYACYDTVMINDELGKHFDFQINVFNHQLSICTDCGSQWEFKVKVCNSTAKDVFLAPEWYAITANKLLD